MAVVLNPLNSFSATGSIGGMQVFRTTKKGNIVARRPTKTKQRTQAQSLRRDDFLRARRLAMEGLKLNPALNQGEVPIKTHLEKTTPQGQNIDNRLTHFMLKTSRTSPDGITKRFNDAGIQIGLYVIDANIETVPLFVKRALPDDLPVWQLIGYYWFLSALACDGYFTQADFVGFGPPLPDETIPINEVCLADNKGNRLVYGVDMPLCWKPREND